MRQTLAVLIISFGSAGAIQAGTAFVDPIYGFSTTSNLPYGTGAVSAGTLNLLLDLYQPTVIVDALPAISPGIVLIHGGAFIGGDKADLASLAEAYATYGYTVTSINYRLLGDDVPPTFGPADFLINPPSPFIALPSPEGNYTVNAAIEDASKAMVWMRDNAALYNIDSNNIAIGGGSAGAITALLQAYNNPPASAAPQAVLSFLGAMYGTEGTIQAGAPPAFVVASSNDTTVPFNVPLGTKATVDRMNAVGVYNEFYEQTIDHTVDFNADFGGKTLFEHNMEFLAQTPVPEPSSLVLCCMAAVALLALARRKMRGLSG